MTLDLSGAVHTNFLSASRRVDLMTPRAAREAVGPWDLFDTGGEYAFFNSAVVAGEVGDAAAALDQAEGWFESRGRPFRLVLRDSEDSELVEEARRRGFETQEPMPAMVLAPIPPPVDTSAGLVITEIDDERLLPAYVANDGGGEWAMSIAGKAFREPDMMLFLGTVAGEPVGHSLGVVSGGTVGIYNVGVAPAFRRRGYGSALSMAAATAGRRLGCTMACLEASAMGFPVYKRLGFRTLYSYLPMARPGAPSFPG